MGTPDRTDEIKTEMESLDPDLAEWFKIDEEKGESPADIPDDSATEADSENEDVKEPDEEPDLDDWFQVKSESENTGTETFKSWSELSSKKPEIEVSDSFRYRNKQMCLFFGGY